MSNKSLLVYPKEAREILGCGNTSFYEWVKLPSFPKPRNPTGGRPMYLRRELEEWVNNLNVYAREVIEDE